MFNVELTEDGRYLITHSETGDQWLHPDPDGNPLPTEVMNAVLQEIVQVNETVQPPQQQMYGQPYGQSRIEQFVPHHQQQGMNQNMGQQSNRPEWANTSSGRRQKPSWVSNVFSSDRSGGWDLGQSMIHGESSDDYVRRYWETRGGGWDNAPQWVADKYKPEQQAIQAPQESEKRGPGFYAPSDGVSAGILQKMARQMAGDWS